MFQVFYLSESLHVMLITSYSRSLKSLSINLRRKYRQLPTTSTIVAEPETIFVKCHLLTGVSLPPLRSRRTRWAHHTAVEAVVLRVDRVDAVEPVLRREIRRYELKNPELKDRN